MSKLQMDAREKLDLLAYLEAILGTVKSLHATLGPLMADVAAIRNSVFDNDEELAFYRNSLKNAAATARPMVDEALRSYDDLIDEIVSSQRWEN